MRQQAENKSGRSRKRRGLICALAALAVIAAAAALYVLCGHGKPEEKLTPEQQIRRDFHQAFDPAEATLSRLNAIRRSFRTAKGFSADQRRAVIIASLAEALNRTFADFASLPPEDKPARAELLRQDAERTSDYFYRLPREKRRRAVALLMNTPEGRAQFNRALSLVGTELTETDREMLAPAIRIWEAMLKDK